MENMSKALVMTGGILIGVILLSIFAYAIRSGGNFARTVDSSIGQTSISKFNAQFESILIPATSANANDAGYRKDLSAHDLITIMNLADNYNSDPYNGIDINVVIPPSMLTPSEGSIMSNTYLKYECVSIGYSQDSGRINYIEFKAI